MLARLLKNTPLGRNRSAADKPPVVIDISRAIKSAPADEELLDMPEAAPEAMGEQAEAAIDALTLQFEGWMRADLEKLRAAWAEVQEENASAETYRAVYTCAHNIHGAAGSYGYSAIGRLCGSLCALLTATPPGENHGLINLHIEACRAILAGGPENASGSAMADAICEALEQRVAQNAAEH